MSDQTTVLLIEDDGEIRHIASLRLRAAGYKTMDAEDGDEGVLKAVAEHPDAIVMDVRMPKKDGMTALVELKEHKETRNIPIVMLSASIVDRQRALEAGARFFLTKPYQGRNLLATVAAAVDKGSQP
ncbi:MAG: response regulator [Planctomycetes bacterium]|nr:response regulator [Planctomycetota bacterium]